jgi:hypothetical protein
MFCNDVIQYMHWARECFNDAGDAEPERALPRSRACARTIRRKWTGQITNANREAMLRGGN